jgi:hypothetical protein
MSCGCRPDVNVTPIFPISNGGGSGTAAPTSAASPSIALAHKPGKTPAIRYIYRPVPILGANRVLSAQRILQTAK